jgi:hypothetical protein
MIAKYCSPSRHASRSNDAISSLQGPHQLAQTLMISGLPRNALSFRGGPFSPVSVASGSVPPIGTSRGVFANPAGIATARHSRRAPKHRSIVVLLFVRSPICPVPYLSGKACNSCIVSR